MNRLHGAFLGSGSLWLMVGFAAANHDLILWGFAGLFIAGIGLRVHPRILGLEGVAWGPLSWALALWWAGLVALALGQRVVGGMGLTAAAGLYLYGLSPWRPKKLSSPAPDWLRLYVKTSYAWLALAGPALVAAELWGSTLLVDGAARHVLASGFILTMMMGMGFRMIPSFELKELAWQGAPVVAFWLLTIGNLVRIAAQASQMTLAVGVGGSLQVGAALVFALVILATLAQAQRSEVSCSLAKSA